MPSLSGLDLVVEDGEFVSLLGPSGSGKTTLGRVVVGLEQPSEGVVEVDDRDVTRLPPPDRGVHAIGSAHPLYGHMTVRQNIVFPLVNAHVPGPEIAARLLHVVGSLELERILDRYPKELGPGETQAVYLARAMLRPPAVLILDEPLGTLAEDDRRRARIQLGLMQRRTRTTTIYITHDQTEAMTLSTRIGILMDGRLQQLVDPMELYRHPVSLQVAQFFGSPAMNTLNVDVRDGQAVLGDLVVPLPDRLTGRRSLVLGVRAEDVHLLPRGAALQVRFVDNTGHDAFVHGTLAGGQRLVLRCAGRLAPRPRETVFVDVLTDDQLLFFDPVTGTRL